jgi:Zn-dependent protease with chaperone function
LFIIGISGCATTTKNFEPGVLPQYTPVATSQAKKTRANLSGMMDEMNLELQQSGPDYKRVKRIINKLSIAANISQELDVYTVDAGDDVNAFAMGGNTIVVYKELLNRLPDDNELSVVLAHELAHILGQHNADQTVQNRSAGLSILSGVVGAAVGAATGNSGLGNLASDGTSMVGTGVVLSYGRAMEHEADHMGMLLMAKAGYHPKHALTVWNKADQVLGAGSSNSFFSSHPSHGNRLERLNDDYNYALPYYKQSSGS